MNISLDTGRSQLQHIYNKLRVRTRTETVVKYLDRHGDARPGSKISPPSLRAPTSCIRASAGRRRDLASRPGSRNRSRPCAESAIPFTAATLEFK